MLHIYYYRYDQEYLGWDLWVWPRGSEGKAFMFQDKIPVSSHPDKFMMVAKIDTDKMIQNEIGLILRNGGWQERDTTADRYIDLDAARVDNHMDMYLVQGDEDIHYSEAEINFIPGCDRAIFQNYREIFIRMQAPTAHTVAEPFIVREDGAALHINRVTALRGGREFLITLEEDFILGCTCTVEKKDFQSFSVMYGLLFDTPEFEKKFTYRGNDLGAFWTPKSTRFRVWAPTAARVQVALYEDCCELPAHEVHDMVVSDNGTWALEISGDLDKIFYTYRVTYSGRTHEAIDPYASATGTNGRRAMIYNPVDTNPPDWEEAKHLQLASPTDAVIYEVHVRDMSMHPDSGIRHKGKFIGLAEENTKTSEGIKTGLAHFAELGITHVHFLPLFDFYTIDESRLHEDHFNWGYDPHLYNVPEGSYATDPRDGRLRNRELKEMILALKRKGIGVIMDVVYNHTYRSYDSEFNKIVPGYYYRIDREGRFSNGSGCGNETASERLMMRKYMVDSIRYWATEYKIDGFRFDLMALHDIDTINDIRRMLDEIYPGIMMYGEGWAGGTSLLEHAKAAYKVNAPKIGKVSMFNDNTRDAIKGDTFNAHEGGYLAGVTRNRESVKFGVTGAVYHYQIDYSRVNYNGFAWGSYPWHCVNYAAAHDNLTLFDKFVASIPNLTETDAMKLTNLAGALVLTSQGVPFLLAGTEFMRTKKGVHNSYNSPDDINQMDWQRKGNYMQVFQYHKGLIKLRKEHPAFRMTSGEEIRRNIKFIPTQEHILAYTIANNANGDAWQLIFVGFNVSTHHESVQLPEIADWHIVADEQTAGTETISTITGNRIHLPARSTIIAWANLR